jgi:hypothetical protein
MNFTVSGVTQAEFAKNQAAYKTVMGNAGGVDPEWVDVTATPKLVTESTTGGRRLLQQKPLSAAAAASAAAQPLALTNQLFSADPSATMTSLQNAVNDGSLSRQLSALGMTLDSGSVSISDNPAPSSGGGTNTGAIVGGVIGGVAGLALIGGAAAYAIKKNKSKAGDALPKTATGTKRGAAMYTENPAFDNAAAAGTTDSGIPQASKSASKTTYDNSAFNAGDPLADTPRAATGAAVDGRNELFESKNSQLSEPDQLGGYTPSEMSQPQSARSRLDSARSGLRSNPTFKPTQDILDSDDDDAFADAGNNPMFESARSGTDLMASAQSDLQMDSARTYDTAPGSSRTATVASARSSQPVSNPMFGSDAAAPESENPLFDGKK